MEERTLDEIANAVEKTIKEIRKELPQGTGNRISKTKKNALIIEACKKNNVSKKHIKTVAGWD
jgi:hypothetical protein